MTRTYTNTARAVADLPAGEIVASVEVAASPERVFRALASQDVVHWWVRPGVFDTREWIADVHVGGCWRASGLGKRGLYVLEGEFLEVDSPRRLAHSWHGAGIPGAATTVTYVVEPTETGSRVTLRHSGFAVPEVCANTAAGWETSFERLAEYLKETP